MSGYCKAISSLKHIDDEDEFIVKMTRECPFDIVVETNTPEGHGITAHGAFDLGNSDNIVDSGKNFFYVHVDAESPRRA